MNKCFKYLVIILFAISLIFIILSTKTFLLNKKRYYDDNVLYIDNFLDEEEYNIILNNINNIDDLKNENFRLIKPLDENNYKEIYDIFYSKKCTNQLKNKTKNYNIFKSDFPIEYRIYPTNSKGMRWHSDTLLYDLPQYEVIYTIDNTSDSKTEWIDSDNKKHSLWTKPNSLLIVKANSYRHCVTPINTGTRSIFKLIFTQSRFTNSNYDNEIERFNSYELR